MDMTFEDIANFLNEQMKRIKMTESYNQNQLQTEIESFEQELEHEIENAEQDVLAWKEENYSVNAIEAEGFLRGLREALQMFKNYELGKPLEESEN